MDVESDLSDAQKMSRITELKSEVENLEKQLYDCEKTNKKWRITTYVGAGAAAATAVGAVVQGVELYKYKRQNSETKTDSQTEQKTDEKK